MGTGYTRQSEAEIAPGNIITAADIEAEFDAIQAAFHGTTGAIHDGTTGEGPRIPLTTSISGVLPVANGGYAGIHKTNGTTAPTVNEDSNDSYAVGSVWIDTTNDIAYVCVDASVGAAVWVRHQVYDAELAALAGLTSAADKGIQFTGSGTAGTYDLTAFAKTILDDANAAAVRSTIGTVIGTDVQAYDVELAALAGLTSAADKGIQFTGSGTAGTYDLTSAGKALLDDASADAQLTTLGVSTFAKTLLDDANAADARTTLGIDASGVNQPLDATLTALAALDGTAGVLVQTGSDAFARRTLTAPAAGITITNPAGTAGNPTLVLANDLAAVEGLNTSGIAVRSASDTWVTREIAEVTGETAVTNANGSAGNISIGLPTALVFTGKTIQDGTFNDPTIDDATLTDVNIDRGTIDDVTIGVITAALLRGHLHGLTLSNNVTDATNDIDIALGTTASDDAIPTLMILASAITKRLDAGWAVGTNQGGLDTGSIANTTYHVFVIRRPDTGVVDVLFSTSAASPTMPTNYTQKRRIGSIIRSGGVIRPFTQRGDIFLTAAQTDRNSTSAIADALFTLSVPVGITVQPLLNAYTGAGNNSSIVVGVGSASTGSSDVRLAWAANNNGTTSDTGMISGGIFTNTSAQIYYVVTTLSGTIASNILNTIGWIDNRGRLV